tara:strand:+ start:874 stop:1584 length:711 start_codon:yes stop_codon:yes gene_type:complete
MIYFIYDTDNNKYFGVYNDITIMNSNIEFLKREDIIKNHSIFKLDPFNFGMTLIENPINIKNNLKKIYLIYDKNINKFICFHSSKDYLEKIINFFEKDYVILETTLNSINLDLEMTIKYIEETQPVKIELLEKDILEISEINREINILKLQQKRLEEKKIEFISDCNLYERFKKEVKKNNNFIIPELFENKFKVMKNLEQNNKLTFDHYLGKDTSKFVKNSYELLFKGGNSIELSK